MYIDYKRLNRVISQRPLGERQAGRTFAAAWQLAQRIAHDPSPRRYLWPIHEKSCMMYNATMLDNHLRGGGMYITARSGSQFLVSTGAKVIIAVPEHAVLSQPFDEVVDDFGEFWEYSSQDQRSAMRRFLRLTSNSKAMAV